MIRARIVAVGTELVQGQITNRNAAWISERLTGAGIEVDAHITVADDRERMREAFESSAERADLIVVTGGLGPTTDDFTRDALAEWSGLRTEFREAAWTKIVRRLTERGIEVALSNRIQCFFPVGAVVLENDEGTADGFRYRHLARNGRSVEVLALPGPPREGQHLWDRHVAGWIATVFPAGIATDLETWNCIGKSESSLGEIVEAVAREHVEVKTGYRASMPYVEVKAWIPKTLPMEIRSAFVARLDAALAPYAVSRNGRDLANAFLESLVECTGNLPVLLVDDGSAGRLTERLVPVLRKERAQAIHGRIEIRTRIPPASEAVNDSGGAGWIVELDLRGIATVIGPKGRESRVLPNPYPNPAMAERLAGYRAEYALKIWTELVREIAARDGSSK